MKLINADEFRRRAQEYYPEYWEEVLDEMPAVDVPDTDVEKLTDEEQRMFLAAMAREKNFCMKFEKLWDDSYLSSDDYVDLVKACEEIERKVKKVLWTED